MSRATRIGSALAGLLVATGVLAGAPSAHAQQSLVDVTVTDTEFTPKELQVKVNESVAFQLQGTQLNHSVTSVDGHFDLVFSDSGFAAMRLPEAKSYAYYCKYAKDRNALDPASPPMDGVIVVSEPAPTTTTSSTTSSTTTSSTSTSTSTTSTSTSSTTTSTSTTSTTSTTRPTTTTSATTTPTTVSPTTRPAVTTSTTRPPGTTTAPTVATTATTAAKAVVQGASQSTATTTKKKPSTKKKKSTTTTAKKKKKATRPASAKPKVQRTTTTSTTLPSLAAAMPPLAAALPSGAGEVPAASSEADLPDATEAGDEAASWVGDEEGKGEARKLLLFGLGGLGALGLASAGLGWSRRSGRYLSP